MEKLRERLRYLQDPHLVARFQHFCGVRGTFSRSGAGKAADRTPTLNNGALHHHSAGESDGDDPDVTGAGEGEKKTGVRMRTADLDLKEGSESPLQNGAAGGAPELRGENGSGAPVKVKPLRKNSLTGDAGQEFLIQNRFLYYMFTLGTELGNESFYITFFPFIIWNVDVFVGRRILLVWAWVMYLGQCTKDLVGWSRPASPPVVKMEVFYNSEYSMPSTHAMSGTAIPFSLFLLTYDRWEYPSSLGFLLALSWCLLVCSSRIYLGMHSVLDVIAGVLYSVLILIFFLPALDVIDDFNLNCHFAPLVIISLPLGLALFSFTLDTWSTSRGDTALILGTGAGIALASHYNHRFGLLPDPTPDRLPLSFPPLGAGLVAVVVLRLVMGVLVLVATRALMKAVTLPLVCRVVGIPSDDMRKARQHMKVELPYRYIVYGAVGFNVLFLVPLLFTYLPLS